MWGAGIEGITKLQGKEMRNSGFQFWLISLASSWQTKPYGLSTLRRETATETSGILYCDEEGKHGKGESEPQVLCFSDGSALGLWRTAREREG